MASRAPWPSGHLALHSDAALKTIQASELHCLRMAAIYGLPVDEVCATAVDRLQDEIDRRREPDASDWLLAMGRSGRTLTGGST
jgi:hypothetical protein